MKHELLFQFLEQLFALSDKLVKIDRTPIHFGVDVPVTRAEIHLVAAIARNEGKSVTELAAIRGVTKGAVSQLLSRLEKKGFVEKIADETNNSRLMIRLTPKGRLANESHDRVHEFLHQVFLEEAGDLDDRFLETLTALFRKADRIIERLEAVKG